MITSAALKIITEVNAALSTESNVISGADSFDFCPGAAAALFYFLAARSKAVLCRHEFGSADTTAAFLNDFFLLCLISAAIEDDGVHQIVSQLLGSAATLRGGALNAHNFSHFQGA